MIDKKKLSDEEGRIRALQRFQILDSEREKPFENIVTLVQQILTVPICAVSLVDTDRQWFKARRGLPVCETARDISFCTHAIRDFQPFIVRDAKADPNFANNPLVTGPPHIGSYAGVPLTTSEGYNVGTLCAIDTKPREFPTAQIDILKNFAQLVVDELELRMTASMDVLTGAMTRRSWTDLADRHVEGARKEARELSIAVFDIDHFKAVNDSYGHPTGDRVLQAVSDACVETLRSGQAVGRIGGEEFAVLLPDCGLEAALRVAENCRAKIERTAVADESGNPLAVTASFGVAALNESVDGIASLMQRADLALYDAKSNGRNRVGSFHDGIRTQGHTPAFANA